MIRINLLPVRELKAEVARRQELTIAVICLILTAIAIGIFHLIQAARLSSHEEELAQLRSEIQSLNAQAKGVTNIRNDIKVLKEKLNVIEQLGKQKAGPARVMENLSTAIPARLWLTEFKEADGSLSITGLAVDNETIANFLKQLATSSYFSDVELGETTQVAEGQGNLKRFVARANLVYRLPDSAPNN